MPSVVQTVREEIRGLDLSTRALRQFGLLMGGVGLAASAWGAWRTGGALTAGVLLLGVVGLGFLVLGVGAPRGLRRVYVGWMGLAAVLGMVSSTVLLTIVYIGVVVPVGLAMQAFGRAPFPRRPDPREETYWQGRPDGPSSRAQYERYY